MYARLRGIENSQIQGVVENLVDTLMLRKHAKKQAGVYRYTYHNSLDFKLVSVLIHYEFEKISRCGSMNMKV